MGPAKQGLGGDEATGIHCHDRLVGQGDLTCCQGFAQVLF